MRRLVLALTSPRLGCGPESLAPAASGRLGVFPFPFAKALCMEKPSWKVKGGLSSEVSQLPTDPAYFGRLAHWARGILVSPALPSRLPA